MTSKEAIADKEALKSCPFCGGGAKIFTIDARNSTYVGCTKTGCQARTKATCNRVEGVIKRWNHRAPSHEGAMCEGDIEGLDAALKAASDGKGETCFKMIDLLVGGRSKHILKIVEAGRRYQQGRIIGKVE